jgi:CBS domain-containing protein
MKVLSVVDIMTQNVMTVRADWSLDQLAEFLVNSSISGAPVVSEDEELIGVVSLTDIVRHSSLPTASPHEYYTQDLETRYAREEFRSLRIKVQSQITVRDIMTPTVFDVSEDATVQEVADLMIRGHIHRVFVTRNKKVMGVVATLDMLKIIRNL